MSRRAVLSFVLGLLPAWAHSAAQNPTAAQNPPAAQNPSAPQSPSAAQKPAAAAGFQRVLWVTEQQASDPAYLARVRAAGYQAINLRPGADPSPVTAADLGFYLDQPAGKGYLELRDADWAPVRNGYEQKRDPALLKRPTCLQDPDLLAATAARSVAAAKALQGPGLRFVAIADEASATRQNQPLDVCRCEACRQALVAFLRNRHGTVQKLNEAWGTEFAEWSDVAALTTDQVRRRELGGTGFPSNLRPYGEVLEFVDGQFAHAVARITADVQAAVPEVPVGLTGIQAPMAFGGHDYARLLPSQTLIEPYDTGGALALARCLRPAADCYATIHAPTDEALGRMLLTAKLSAMAAQGLRGAVVWNGDTVLGEKAATPFAEQLTVAFSATQAALDACAGAELTYSDVWLVESQASVRAWWMLDSAADGMTWVRRMPSHEATHSTSLALRRSWTKLLGDLGITPRFVPESVLPERLLQQRPRLLVLPGTIALGDRSCQAITAYVQNGGAVLADHSPALYDEHLRLRSHPALDELFGIQARSNRLADLRVREGSLLGKGNLLGKGSAVVAEAGLRGRLGEERAVEPVQGEIGESGLEVRSQRDGSEQVFLEFRPGKGRAVYLNLPVCLYDRQRLDAAAGGAAQDLRRRVRQVLQTVFAMPPFGVRGEGLPVFLHRTVLQTRDGRRILTLRLDVQDQPQLLQQLARNPARTVQCTFARPVHLRTLLGEDLGTKDGFELPFDVLAGLFVIEGGS